MPQDWIRDAVIYQIFIDRFAGYRDLDWEKPQFIGGNLKAITEKVPYIKKLGANAVWLSPFNECSAYHGYHVTDYMRVDPHFGTLKDLRQLIESMHKAGIRVIGDFVANHCSARHPFFLDAQKSRSSRYYDWFIWKKWPSDYVGFLSFKEMAKLNLENAECRNYIIAAAKYWLKQGLDGFRLDHVIGPKHSFWQDFRTEIKRDFPDALLIGEATMFSVSFSELDTVNVRDKKMRWLAGPGCDSLLKSYYGELDGVLDFRFQGIMKSFVALRNPLRPSWLMRKMLSRHFSSMPSDYILATFLDNHDMDRFLFLAKGDKEKLKEAARIQFSISQPKIIYYGTESGLMQKRPVSAFKADGDLQVRQPMNWKSIDPGLFRFYQNLIRGSR